VQEAIKMVKKDIADVHDEVIGALVIASDMTVLVWV
jgi:hypothetical protein